jgi:hypothetical protein
MSYQFSGWLNAILGIILVSLGAFLVSGGWALISERKSIRELIKKCFRADVLGLLFIGSILIGIGSTLTTFGWNQLNSASQKKALIVALAREWLLNEFDTLGEPMTFDANDPNLGIQHFMYPHFRTSAQDHILTSELFDLRDRRDNKLLLAVILYKDMIVSFNTLLDLENEQCLRFPENVKQQKRKDVYLAIRDINALHIHFKRYHKELLYLLEKDYNWALDEARPALDYIKKQKETIEQ